jgi:tRNA threonylcarbamoyladenosine biosynthesis protein TsaB
MTLILSIETSGKNCSVAIHRNGELIAAERIETPQSHAAKLAVIIEKVMVKSTTNLNRLNAVAISSGPGSYTGLRIGAATAKGLCYGLNIPLIAVNTLDLLSVQAKDRAAGKVLLCPMIDARRMEVYCKVVSLEGKEIVPMNATTIDERSFEDLLSRSRILFFGDGAVKCKEVIRHPNAFFSDNIYPDASGMGQLADQMFQRKHFAILSDFEPDYLKEFLIRKAAVSAATDS